jgi:hypothetical protein
MGMDWHSSGITTSVMGALKRGLNPRFADLGLMVCGGRGRHSIRTLDELRAFGMKTGLDGDARARTSRLTGRVDNNAVADGFQIYLHSFVITRSGETIQRGVITGTGQACRTSSPIHTQPSSASHRARFSIWSIPVQREPSSRC